MSKKPKIFQEISREVYGGGDGRAINRHSVRTYESDTGQRFQIDRTLDGAPPWFELYHLPSKNAPPVAAGRTTFLQADDGMSDEFTWAKSWKKAVEQACLEHGWEISE